MSNLLKDRRPDLEQYWSPVNFLNFDEATIGQRTLATFQCHNSHGFEREIKKIANQLKFKCEQCFYNNSFAVKFPEISKLWNYEKNSFPPEKSASTSKSSVWWNCVEGHSYKSTIDQQIIDQRCSHCEPRSNSKVFESYPELKFRWSSRNVTDPTKVSSWDKNLFWWICENDHVYERTIYREAVLQKTCRMCEQGGSVFDVRDSISVVYDESKNKIPSKDLYRHSRSKAWWTCSDDHSFEREVKDQVMTNRMCPICSKNGGSISTLEKEIRSFIIDAYPNLEIFSNFKNLPKVSDLDIYIPSLKLGIDVNGEYWHSDSIAQKNGWESAETKHFARLEKFKNLDIKLAMVWEDDWINARDETIKSIRKFIDNGILEDSLKRVKSNRNL